jgi:hypothetical protein
MNPPEPAPGPRPRLSGELLACLEGHQDAAQSEVDQLTAQIAELTDRLTAAHARLERLRLTRQTLLEIATPADRHARSIDTLPTAYQQILTALATNTDGMRAKDLCRALGAGTQPRHTEAMRARLKRLVGRDILREPEPGLFIINDNNTPEH